MIGRNMKFGYFDDNGAVAESVFTAWKRFEVARCYRGVRYDISVVREGKGNSVTLEVDGKSINGTVVLLPDKNTTLAPHASAGETVKVKAVIRS